MHKGGMRRLLLALCLLLGQAPLAQARDCSHLFLGGRPPAITGGQAGLGPSLCFIAFAVRVSSAARDPLWSAEYLSAHYARIAPFRRRAGSFHPEQRLPPADRAYPRDYGRGWDRGHMTPAGDIASRRAKDETFSMANIVPQRPRLNRGIWAEIEIALRHLAERTGGVFIVTGPVLQPGDARTPNGRVQIPSATWKAIWDPAERRGGAWICTNSNRPRCRTVSLAALDQAVGVAPFPALSPAETSLPPLLPKPEPWHSTARHGGHPYHHPTHWSG